MPAVQESLETWVRFLGWEDPLGWGTQPTALFLPGESHGQWGLRATVQRLQSRTRPQCLSTAEHLAWKHNVFRTIQRTKKKVGRTEGPFQV